jgi:hypothetical protein
MTATRFIVKSIRVSGFGPERDQRGDLFGSRKEAEAAALACNCKPFTPFFWFVVEA